MGDPDAPCLFMCFTGIKQAMGGVGTEEFVGSTSRPGWSAIFVSDLQRTWFNGFEPTLLQDILGQRASGRRVVTVGNSMGGFGAVWASSLFDVETAIAFAPQFSVNPAVVPEEKRWMEYRERIDRWRHESLAPFFNKKTRYYTINGDEDSMHWRRFPESANCEHVLIERSGHDPARTIKAHGSLSGLLDTCLAGGGALHYLQSQGIACRRTA